MKKVITIVITFYVKYILFIINKTFIVLYINGLIYLFYKNIESPTPQKWTILK